MQVGAGNHHHTRSVTSTGHLITKINVDAKFTTIVQHARSPPPDISLIKEENLLAETTPNYMENDTKIQKHVEDLAPIEFSNEVLLI